MDQRHYDKTLLPRIAPFLLYTILMFQNAIRSCSQGNGGRCVTLRCLCGDTESSNSHRSDNQDTCPKNNNSHHGLWTVQRSLDSNITSLYGIKGRHVIHKERNSSAFISIFNLTVSFTGNPERICTWRRHGVQEGRPLNLIPVKSNDTLFYSVISYNQCRRLCQAKS